MNHIDLGRYCEELASQWMQDQGYQIIKRNFRGSQGEIDLICRKRETLVFAEVKHIGKSGIESLAQLVGARKQAKILLTAKEFLLTDLKYENLLIRFDVLGIDADKISINHLENAFGEKGLL